MCRIFLLFGKVTFGKVTSNISYRSELYGRCGCDEGRTNKSLLCFLPSLMQGDVVTRAVCKVTYGRKNQLKCDKTVKIKYPRATRSCGMVLARVVGEPGGGGGSKR